MDEVAADEPGPPGDEKRLAVDPSFVRPGFSHGIFSLGWQ
jgi:hypothetical protein